MTDQVEYVGEFQDRYYKISVCGFLVPKLKARKSDSGEWSVTLDGRFSIDVKEDEMQRWVWILANAMAISAGYSCFGENCVPLNIYKTRIVGLSLEALNQLNNFGGTDLVDFPELRN